MTNEANTQNLVAVQRDLQGPIWGLGETPADALAEPIGNGVNPADLMVIPCDARTAQQLVDFGGDTCWSIVDGTVVADEDEDE